MPTGAFGGLFNLAAAGRAFVESTLWANRNAILATLFGKRFFAALAAQDHVPATIDRRAAAENGTFVQATNGAGRRAFLAAILAAFDMAAQTAERHLKFFVMRMGNTDLLLLATAGSYQQKCTQAQKLLARIPRHRQDPR